MKSKLSPSKAVAQSRFCLACMTIDERRLGIARSVAREMEVESAVARQPPMTMVREIFPSLALRINISLQRGIGTGWGIMGTPLTSPLQQQPGHVFPIGHRVGGRE